MNSPKLPKPPSADTLSKKQQTANVNAAQQQQLINSTNQVTPWGSLTYKQGPNGQWTATTSLDPEQQKFLDTSRGYANQLLGKIGTSLTTPIDLSNTAIMDQIASVYEPGFQRQGGLAYNRLQTDLANRGLTPGSTAWDNAMTDFQTAQSEAWNNILENARQQSVNEMITQRQEPLQELGALEGFTSPMSLPLVSTPQASVSPTNVAGIAQNAYEQQLARANMQQQQNNAMLGGLFGLGGAALQAIPML